MDICVQEGFKGTEWLGDRLGVDGEWIVDRMKSLGMLVPKRRTRRSGCEELEFVGADAVDGWFLNGKVSFIN